MNNRPAARSFAGVGLFDRLVGQAEDEQPRVRRHPDAELHAAVVRDLFRLMNTRRGSSAPLDPATATVLDYGIPNFIPMSSLHDMERMAKLIQDAVRIFEPRLLSPEVQLSPVDNRPDQLAGSITGILRGGRSGERVTFALAVDPQSGAAEVLPPEE